MPRAPGGPLLEQLGAREGEDEQRLVARPLQKVFDEVEEGGVRPLHVLERKDRRVGVGESLKNSRQAANRSCRSWVAPSPRASS